MLLVPVAQRVDIMRIIMLAAAIETARAINMFDFHGTIILDRLSLAPSRSASLEQLFVLML